MLDENIVAARRVRSSTTTDSTVKVRCRHIVTKFPWDHRRRKRVALEAAKASES